MSALTRFERMDDLFPEMFRRFVQPTRFANEAPADIRIDVSENDKEYSVRAEIPGAKKDDIRVTVDGNFVQISAEIRKETEEKDKDNRVLLRETYYGSASRGFTLAQDVDSKAVVAKLEDGVLKLTLPKSQGVGSRLIPIN